MKSNSLTTNLNYVSLLIIIKNTILLLFIGVFFMSIISLFTKTKNNKIIEGFSAFGAGSWFESKEDKRKREQREREEAEEAIRRARAPFCINPTAGNREYCGTNYYFPTTHMEAGGGEAIKNLKKKMDSSKKADPKMTSKLNSKLNVY
jgi:hypothetical protein